MNSITYVEKMVAAGRAHQEKLFSAKTADEFVSEAEMLNFRLREISKVLDHHWAREPRKRKSEHRKLCDELDSHAGTFLYYAKLKCEHPTNSVLPHQIDFRHVLEKLRELWN